MFILDGKPLSPDRSFTHDSIQYPANWLRLATLEQKIAIGITEVPDPPFYDQRFYWGHDQDGHLIPKDHSQLVVQWVAQTKDTAGSLLSSYDWYIVREAETGKPVPQEVLTYRAAVRTTSDNREVIINGTTTTEQLAAVITSDFNGLFPWPRGPFDPAPVSDEDTIPPAIDNSFVGGTTSGSISDPGNDVVVL